MMVLAGTFLPLALAYRWGPVWPAWTLWAGTDVPRWIVLGPALLVAIGLLAYFGVGGLTASLLGNTAGAVEITGYVVWGIGLAMATASYALLTRRPCRAGGTGRTW
ncbi:hypothetical protein E1267_06540 [Nonomuraea longispora]|uniref:Uncharacterized protein n=2 Tax=Nonomuraea longispora TaxID=1848320 RepID=A0A4R4NPK1_9ACTN|nr:hypothetical protein E1267_06540 [Nonomuraea longispora]